MLDSRYAVTVMVCIDETGQDGAVRVTVDLQTRVGRPLRAPVTNRFDAAIGDKQRPVGQYGLIGGGDYPSPANETLINHEFAFGGHHHHHPS